MEQDEQMEVLCPLKTNLAEPLNSLDVVEENQDVVQKTPKREKDPVHALLEISLERIRVLEGKVEALQSSPVSQESISTTPTTINARIVEKRYNPLMKSLLTELKSKIKNV